MKEKIQNALRDKRILLILFIMASIIFAVPSIRYMIQNGTVLNFNEYFKFCLDDSNRIGQAIIYIAVLVILTLSYFSILKSRKKLFKNIKEVYIYIAIISLIFVFVIPFLSSDIFYYLGIGRLDSQYNQNPYYVTIKDFVESGENSKYLEKDTVLAQGYSNDWGDTTVVYGPVWTFICRIVAGITFGNIDFALLVFKLLNMAIHIVNSYLIYKLTGKKLFVLLYGINPYMLIEGIANVHNDIYVVAFILASLYFLLKKKNLIISILFLALATAIKYFAILLLPFVIIYHFRDKKPSERLKKCIIYGILFLLIIVATYVIYVQDLQVLNGILTQQEKYAKNFYIILMEYFNIPNLASKINSILLIIFIYIYFSTNVELLCEKKISFRRCARKYEYFLLAFLFLLITNFQPWYIMWLFPLMMWQKKRNMQLIVQISLISQFANTVFLINGEGWRNGTPFTFFMLLGISICLWLNQERDLKRKALKYRKQLEVQRRKN